MSSPYPWRRFPTRLVLACALACAALALAEVPLGASVPSAGAAEPPAPVAVRLSNQPTPTTAVAPVAADTPATTPATAAVTVPHIIPRPNSGRAPRDAGERGGAQQNLLFGLICAALVVLGVLVWRDSRRKLAARARAASSAQP